MGEWGADEFEAEGNAWTRHELHRAAPGWRPDGPPERATGGRSGRLQQRQPADTPSQLRAQYERVAATVQPLVVEITGKDSAGSGVIYGVARD